MSTYLHHSAPSRQLHHPVQPQNQNETAPYIFIKDQKKPTFVFEHDELKKQSENREELDPLFSEVAKYVVEKKNCSINSIQREFNLGFNRAQSIVVSLVKFGIVENSDGTKAKQVNISLYELDEILRDL